MRPFHLERKIVPKVWGGSSLSEMLCFDVDEGTAVGETWELFDRPEGSSRLRDSDRSLAEVMASDPVALLGARTAAKGADRFPLLIKFLDAGEALSIQVHPDDELAAADDDLGKFEAWLVLAVGAEGRIVHGLREGSGHEDLVAAISEGRALDVLRSFRPAVGDMVEVPPGTVHSIGPDVVVFEVQRNSDLTYRLYDWGRDRELHLEKALAAAARAPESPATVSAREVSEGRQLLLRNSDFELQRLQVQEPVTLATEGDFRVLNVLSGLGTIAWHSGGEDPPLRVEQGDCVVVPACIERVFLSAAVSLDLLVTGPGDEA